MFKGAPLRQLSRISSSGEAIEVGAFSRGSFTNKPTTKTLRLSRVAWSTVLHEWPLARRLRSPRLLHLNRIFPSGRAIRARALARRRRVRRAIPTRLADFERRRPAIRCHFLVAIRYALSAVWFLVVLMRRRLLESCDVRLRRDQFSASRRWGQFRMDGCL